MNAALAEPVEEAVAHARAQPAKHVDASTWRIGGAYAALWTIAAPLVAVFFVTKDACANTVASLLGTLTGTLITDRGSQFGFWAMERRQICWAHLIRKFVAFTQRKDEGAQVGESLLLIAQAMLSAWHDVRDGTLSRRRYQEMAKRAQAVIESQLVRGVELRLKGYRVPARTSSTTRARSSPSPSSRASIPRTITPSAPSGPSYCGGRSRSAPRAYAGACSRKGS